MPELAGRFDARNPSHKMLVSVLGGMSESERQHVQARVRAAMDAQVVNEGGGTSAAGRRTATPGSGCSLSTSPLLRSCVGSSPNT